MAYQYQLVFAHVGNDAGKVCLLQDLRVGCFVLPADVEKVSDKSESEVVKLNKLETAITRYQKITRLIFFSPASERSEILSP